MQHPVLGYIDGTRLISVTITQLPHTQTLEKFNFHLENENGTEIKILSAERQTQTIHLTGEFFNWEIKDSGKMIWNEKENYYYLDLPENQVMDKEFKFIENNCIWYPAGENLKVENVNDPAIVKGYIFKEGTVRFILQTPAFGFKTCEFDLVTSKELQPDKTYFLSFDKFKTVKLINRNIFDQKEYFYSGNDLGCLWSKDKSVFKLWSPVADQLKILLFSDSQSEQPEREVVMHRQDKGVWSAEIEGNLHRKYYLYEIKIDRNVWRQIDPYSKALSVNSRRTLIFDPAAAIPQDWENQLEPLLPSPVDAVIYEMHVRDFSISPYWQGKEELRGKYLGICWSGKISKDNQEIVIGLEHLKELGINVIQLMPVFDFNSVDESGKDSGKLRNWGYDPFAYNVPEGSYALEIDYEMRLLEFREMIICLHNMGFKVVMDVVYNHTANVGAPYSIFDTFMPEYFYRMDRAGHYTNGSGCGNEIATEKKMVGKYILDSLLYWTEKYKIDGFRFDLMGLIDLETMQNITTGLRKIKKDILIYGEPWAGGSSPLKTPVLKGSQKESGFAVFNDDFRDSLRGDTDGFALGWAMGDLSRKKDVIKGIMGSIDNFTASPTETINYISAHDNYTWYDKLVRSTTETAEAQRIKMAKLGLAVVILSQGIPFLHAGSEFLRTKRVEGASEEEIRNSYKADDEVNKLDWARKAQYYEFFSYIKRLLEIRRDYEAFRLQSLYEIRDRFVTLKKGIPEEVIAYCICGKNVKTDIIVIHNPLPEKKKIKLPEGLWKLIFDENYADRKRQGFHIEKSIIVDSISTAILELD